VFVAWVTKLVHDHRGELARVARREGLTAEDAFDAVQEAFQRFVTLPSAESLVDARTESRNLLATLTRNVARNRRRLHAIARPHDGGDATSEIAAASASVEETIAEAEERIRLRTCVGSLADVQRAVVTLRMLDEVAGEDVARALGLTPGHVAVLLHRAKANLLTCMTGETK
jgi:RNA polymerase sigma-70 factor (ECF subfamily)